MQETYELSTRISGHLNYFY